MLYKKRPKEALLDYNKNSLR